MRLLKGGVAFPWLVNKKGEQKEEGKNRGFGESELEVEAYYPVRLAPR